MKDLSHLAEKQCLFTLSSYSSSNEVNNMKQKQGKEPKRSVTNTGFGFVFTKFKHMKFYGLIKKSTKWLREGRLPLKRSELVQQSFELCLSSFFAWSQ